MKKKFVLVLGGGKRYFCLFAHMKMKRRDRKKGTRDGTRRWGALRAKRTK